MSKKIIIKFKKQKGIFKGRCEGCRTKLLFVSACVLYKEINNKGFRNSMERESNNYAEGLFCKDCGDVIGPAYLNVGHITNYTNEIRKEWNRLK